MVSKCKVEAEQAKQSVSKFWEEAEKAKVLAKQEAEVKSHKVSESRLKMSLSTLEHSVKLKFCNE